VGLGAIPATGVSRPPRGYVARVVDDVTELERVRRAARAAVAAARDLEEFGRRLALPTEPATLVEYAALIAREEEARAVRDEAFDAVGLGVPSLGEPAQPVGEPAQRGEEFR
jgi:hypothetical protein